MKELIELFFIKKKKGIIISWLLVLFCIFIVFDSLWPLLASVDFGSDSC